jgi:hypothetical protein
VTRAERKAARRTSQLRSTSPNHDKPHPEPHSDDGKSKECKWCGNAIVSGEIVVKPPPDLLAEYKASQKDNKSNNDKTRLMGWLTLAAVVIYAFVTVLLWCSAQQANSIARENFQKEQRPWIALDRPKPTDNIIIQVGQIVRWDVQFINYGKSPAAHVSTKNGIWVGMNAMTEMEHFFSTLPIADPHTGKLGFFVPMLVGDGSRNTPGFTYNSILGDRAVTDEDAAFMRANDGGVVAAARVWYSDTFDNAYRTDFCDIRLKTGAISHYEPHTEIH